MAMTAAELIAYLRMDKSGFDRGLSSAEGQMRKTDSRFRDWAKGMGRATAETITVGAAAAGGLAATVFATGVNYNTLQQQSRAALATIMGGAEEANAQMDKLDEFATTSPFAKDVFIQAQQQLLGFGQEAERVVPTLEAVQDAVAATGGSNEDIAELVRIIAQLEGGVKISAETLNQFGTRGIDAAQLIGDAMGKTGEQIREEITAGTLDADEAVQALTDGMSERFGGAAANVKETMTGAFDRVKAATRDIGAELAAPFVDPNGGGLAVDWTNQFADALRAVERQTGPFVEMMMARYAPAFDNVTIALKDAKDAIDGFDMADLEAGLDRASSYAPAIAGLSAALTTMGLANVPIIGRLASALGPIPAALGAAALASPEMRDALGELWEASKPLVETLGDLGILAAGTFSDGIRIAADVIGITVDVVKPLVDGFAALPDPIRNAATAAVIFNAAGRPMPRMLTGMADGARTLGRRMGSVKDTIGGWAGAFEGATGSTGDFKAAVGLAAGEIGKTAKTGLRGAANGIMGLFGGPWGIALMGAIGLLTLYSQHQADAKAKTDELKASLDEQTGAFTAASEEVVNAQLVQHIQDTADELQSFGDYMEAADVSVSEMTAAIIDQGDAYDHLLDKLTEASMGAAGIDDEESARRMAKKSEIWEYVEEQVEAQRVAQEAAEALAEAERERYLAMDDSARANERFKDSMREVADETINTSDRVKALKAALDELEGGAKTQEERDRELATTQRDLNGWFEDNAEAIAEMDENLIDMSTGMPSHTELGNQLEGMLSRMGDSAHQTAIELRDRAEAEGWSTEKTQEAIKEAYEPYISTLQDLEEQGYLTQDEVDALTESIIGVPEVTAFAITHGDTVTLAELEVLELIDKIEATPDKDFKISDGDTSQEAMDILEDLGYDIENIEDGEFTVTPVGIDKAEEIVDEFVNKDRTIDVGVKVNTYVDDLGGMMPDAPSFLPKELRGGRYHGGIDIKGMASGGVTGASVMDVAQFVPPGEIRFAGDRSDVDEAWIPLDGSLRSRNILEEAIRRMPNFELPAATGMAAGGISGDIEPPKVGEVNAPDTTPLESVWTAAMDRLEEDTRSTFDTIHNDTGAAQSATTATTASNMAAMAGVTSDNLSSMTRDTMAAWDAMSRDTTAKLGSMHQVTGSELAAMSSATASNLGTMNQVTGSELASMTSATASNLSSMRSTTDSETSTMRNRATAEFEGLREAGSTQTARLADRAAAEFLSMRTDGISEATTLKTRSSEQFSDMQEAGTTAARNLKDGLVSEISNSRSPFTGHVNDLVEVMRSFSESLNSAYGDMGVDVGSPSRVAFASGGILPGYTPGRDVHRFYSPTAGQVDLSGGEAIMRPEVTRAMGSSWVHSLNAAARTGGVSRVRQLMGRTQPRQAFADGGIIGSFMGPAHDAASEHKAQLPSTWLKPAGSSTIDQVIAGLEERLEEMMSAGGAWVRPTTGRVTSRYGARGGSHHAGMDIAEREGAPVVAAAPGRVVDTGTNIGPGRTGEGILLEHLGRMFSYYGHNPRGGIRVSPGDAVMAGQRIGAQGTTGNVTGAHLHWEIHRNRAWADINPHPFWDAAGAGSSLVEMGTSGGSDRWAPVIRAALMRNGLPVTDAYVSAWLRQVQTESGGNPAARQRVNDINMRLGRPAEGLLQVIPPTFRAHAHPGHNNPFNPLDNALAAVAYAKARYGASGMLNAIGRGRGYQNGIMSAEPGWHAVGEYGPELVRFKGGETVRNNAQSRSLVAAQRLTRAEADLIGKAIARHGGNNAGVHLHGPVTRDTDELVRKSADVYRRTTKMLSRKS